MQEYQDQAARIIQHHVKHWLWSPPRGPMLLKMVADLQWDGYLTT
jgi:hypothetical protein